MFTIKDECTNKIQIKGSVFICNLINFEKIEDAKLLVNKISNKYKDATHNCYAYRLGLKNILEYSSDDKEPPGSAGKPILITLKKYNLTNVISIVTRYFGGSKLGIRGLIEAYSSATENTIKISKIVEVFEKEYFTIECDYRNIDKIKNKIIKLGGIIEKVEYTSIVKLNACIKKENSLLLEKFLKQERINYYNETKS